MLSFDHIRKSFGDRIALDGVSFTVTAGETLGLLGPNGATFGLMLTSVGRSVGATRGIAVMVVLLLVMLGGAWVPSFVFRRWLQQVSLFVPTRWAVDGLDAMTWRELPLSAAVEPLMVRAAQGTFHVESGRCSSNAFPGAHSLE